MLRPLAPRNYTYNPILLNPDPWETAVILKAVKFHLISQNEAPRDHNHSVDESDAYLSNSAASWRLVANPRWRPQAAEP
jgi:hypothetical protein